MIFAAGLEGVRILITGANGFVGRHLIAHLLRSEGAPSDLRITAAVMPGHVEPLKLDPDVALGPEGWRGGSVDGRIEVVGLDIRDAAAAAALVSCVRPACIYHLAARASGADTDREAIAAVNVAGTRHVLEAASALAPFPRVLLVSSGYVYGDTDPNRPAREDDPLSPLGRYGAYTDSKIEMETVARDYRAFAVVARAFSHIGPGQTPAFAIPSFARQLARMEAGLEPPVLHVGNLEARRDILDVRDVVAAYTALMRRGAPGSVYNVATAQPMAIRAILERLKALCGIATETVVDPNRLRPADIACSSGDPSRLAEETGWSPRYGLEETLSDLFNSLRASIRQAG